MKRCVFLMMLAAVGSACVTHQVSGPREQLYLAVEVEQNGVRLAAPRLVGFEGRNVIAQRQPPGALKPDYRLRLSPKLNGEGQGYTVTFDLALPSGLRHGELGLLHGEESTIRLDPQTKVTMLLMRVDSDEFRALMGQHGPISM